MSLETCQTSAPPILFCSDTEMYPDAFHLTRFLSSDPLIALEHGTELVIVVGSVHVPRAREVSRATKVLTFDECGFASFLAQGQTGDQLMASVVKTLLDLRGVKTVRVPRYFFVGVADRLRAMHIELEIVEDLASRRRAKGPDEISALEQTQRATEDAWSRGIDAIKRASIRTDGTLELGGEIFTAERLRALIEGRLRELDCTSDDAILAPGRQAADPHAIGTGPLRANEPIVMDIFPRHRATRYWADMTRTVSKGRPSDDISRMYEVVMAAQAAAIRALRPGITGHEVHELVEDVIWAAGYDTLRPGQQRTRKVGDPPRGFIHAVGHGVGLDLHEQPVLARTATEPLEVGDVVTVEPGLYDPEFGGVRLEDMLVITAAGSRNFTRAIREFVV